MQHQEQLQKILTRILTARGRGPGGAGSPGMSVLCQRLPGSHLSEHIQSGRRSFLGVVHISAEGGLGWTGSGTGCGRGRQSHYISSDLLGIILMRIIAKVQDRGIYKCLLTAAAEIVMKRKTIIAEI